MKLLIANRGEIALRIAQAAAELHIKTVSLFAEDEPPPPTGSSDQPENALLTGRGSQAFMDAEQIIQLAIQHECTAIHPGYGFLSENSAFAKSVADAGLTFIGPSPEILALFGDKIRAKALARACDVPTIPGTEGISSEAEVEAFLLAQTPGVGIVLKALAGGGGRGLRIVHQPEDLHQAYQRCEAEAQTAFGNGALYAEQLIQGARHIEVQIIGDHEGAINHLWERDCSLQRRHQKLIEIAPAPGLDPAIRKQLIDASLRMAREVNYSSLGTFEFLVDADTNIYFIEGNPRLQVEHPVTEVITDVDLVQLQLELARGHTLSALGLDHPPPPVRGYAIECRINAERLTREGQVYPTTGQISAFQPATGPGVRLDSSVRIGSAVSGEYDSLLAKLIVRSRSDHFVDALSKTHRSLEKIRIQGVETNLSLLRRLLQHQDLLTAPAGVAFVQEHLHDLIDEESTEDASSIAGDSPKREISAPMQGTLVELLVQPGDIVTAGQPLLIMQAMKMEHVLNAPAGGLIESISVQPLQSVSADQLLMTMEARDIEVDVGWKNLTDEVDLEHIRPDLSEVVERHAIGLDEARSEAIEKRHRIGHRSARENIQDLCDPESFIEYGPLVIAAQRRRRSLDDLIQNTPGDGMVAGIGQVNSELFMHLVERDRQCVLMSYDYTVLAGTQGAQNHRKKDRMFELAEKWQLPVVIFTEGGGGRPGDTDGIGGSGLDCLAFAYFARLSGLVPLVGITSGRCFAGNAALLGCCDVVIATADSNVGMGGPAMIEGGGLGVVKPEQIGPIEVQVANGVIDIAVNDEQEAVAAAKKYLSYFQGRTTDWRCGDQRLLRHLIPENRLRIYDVRQVIESLSDTDSVLELRQGFAPGMVTSLLRIEGWPVGVIANNPAHLAGAIDSNGADKAARFMQLCDAFNIPLLFLCDTPGIMVGPEAEETALVRHAARMFLNGASLSIPFFTIVLRKGYGLGAQAMAGGSFKSPFFTVSWPTGEFGGMGLEGAVKLGYRKELEAVEDEDERDALYEKMVAKMYQHGKAVNTASYFMLDDVIDPMQSRNWILAALNSVPDTSDNSRSRPCIDAW